MRKLFAATAVCALAVGLTVAPGAIGKKSTKQVASTVTVTAAPSPITPATTAVTASGNVKANSSCRKNRTVRFYYLTNGVAGLEVGSTDTRSNGDFSTTLAPPAPITDGTTQVRAIVDQNIRTKVIKGKNKGANKGKKKGKTNKRKFNCLSGTGDSNVLITDDPSP